MKCALCVRRANRRHQTQQHDGEPTNCPTCPTLPHSDNHTCINCAAWLQRQVAEIITLAADAAAWIAPRTSQGTSSRPNPDSRPPINVSALDPENTTLPCPLCGHTECDHGRNQTILETLESWERMCRQMRHMAPYGIVSETHTEATLTAVCRFLGTQIAWMSTEPDWPIEDFTDEISACVSLLRHWDITREKTSGHLVECPHETDDGTCGHLLRIDHNDAYAYFTCPSCVTEWSVDRLMLVWADTRDAAMWLDADAVQHRYGIDARTLRRWVKEGRIEKSHGRYDIRALTQTRRTGT